MSRKLALKRLSQSDLSLFKRYFDANPSSKQKGINLNANVLTGALYPSMPSNGQLPVQLHIYGPGPTVQPEKLMRKIVKSPAAKNWRLNGELVNDPISGDPLRYGMLTPGDLVLMEFFDGASGYPARIRMILLSASNAADAPLHNALDVLLPAAKAMIVLTQNELVRTVGLFIPSGHPMQDFLTEEEELELLATGGDVELGEPEPEPEPAPPAKSAPATPRAPRAYKPRDFNKTARPSLSRVSAETLAKSKVSASENGEAGEELVSLYLEEEASVISCEWTSRINAIAPYDFKLDVGGAEEMIDVKTTVGAFEAAFHISINELKQAACAPGVYRIYRVYDIKGQPRLRISGDIKEFAAELFAYVQALPEGIIADGFTLKPYFLQPKFLFGDEIILPVGEE